MYLVKWQTKCLYCQNLKTSPGLMQLCRNNYLVLKICRRYEKGTRRLCMKEIKFGGLGGGLVCGWPVYLTGMHLSINAQQKEIFLAKFSQYIQPTPCHCLSSSRVFLGRAVSMPWPRPRPGPGALRPTTVVRASLPFSFIDHSSHSTRPSISTS